MSKNLDPKKTDPLRERYPALFGVARNLHGQCTILDHKYEVAGIQVAIDWNSFWDTLNHRLPDELKPLLEHAIATEEAREQEAQKEDKKK